MSADSRQVETRRWGVITSVRDRGVKFGGPNFRQGAIGMLEQSENGCQSHELCYCDLQRHDGRIKPEIRKQTVRPIVNRINRGSSRWSK